jgi:predicted O-linked N-acetylglucosamine transferase (SPINDLY family)
MSAPIAPYRSPKSDPGRSEAERHWRAAVDHGKAGRWTQAESASARAVRMAPGEAVYWVNLAQARRKLGDLTGALAACDGALRADPRFVLARQIRVAVLMDRHRYEDLLEDAEVVARRPGAGHDSWLDYGIALERTNRHVAAVGALLQALSLKPDCFEAYIVLCNAFDRLKLNAEAVECVRTAVALQPGWPAGLAGIVHHSLHACDWRQLDEDLAALARRLEQPGPIDVNPFMFLSFGADAATQRRIFAEHARLRYAAVAPLPPPPAPTLPPPARVRVAYLSNDFHTHATALLIVQVLELHDRSRIDVRLYSYGSDDGSPLRRRLEAAGEAFVDISGLSEPEAAQRIRDDGVEILVDLKGYTMHARTAIMARRPAPVQVAWLGFPGTMAAPFIDYAIVDPVVVPPSMAEGFSEALAWLPDCYQPNDRLREVGTPPGRAACGLPDDGFVFCCFNHTYKIRPDTFDVWCRLLAEVPGSVLWLLASNAQAEGNLRREAAARGIEPSRIVFAPVVKPPEHLARLSHADLFLDTLPINAHTTASDALWVGVPVLTCTGAAFVGRVAASLLNAVGLPELAVEDLAAYERLARALATDPARLAALRARLRDGRETAPLFDSARTARELDALYLRMAERWRAGLAPAALPPRPVSGATDVAASRAPGKLPEA